VREKVRETEVERGGAKPKIEREGRGSSAANYDRGNVPEIVDQGNDVFPDRVV
jgi:hypothetical protein